MARRDTTDPDNTGAYLKWAFSWPANRRILYNRASANLEGKAWDPKRKLIEWNGEKWTRLRRARHRAYREAGSGRPLHHEPGRRRPALGQGIDEGRSVPKPLRALRKPGGEPGRSQDPGQSGGARLQERSGSRSARQRSSPMPRPATGWRSISTSGRSTARSMPPCSRNSSWRSPRSLPRRKASRKAAGCAFGPSAARSRPRPW